jgi:hypothetical protein
LGVEGSGIEPGVGCFVVKGRKPTTEVGQSKELLISKYYQD